jgi:hypothetical protein
MRLLHAEQDALIERGEAYGLALDALPEDIRIACDGDLVAGIRALEAAYQVERKAVQDHAAELGRVRMENARLTGERDAARDLAHEASKALLDASAEGRAISVESMVAVRAAEERAYPLCQWHVDMGTSDARTGWTLRGEDGHYHPGKGPPPGHGEMVGLDAEGFAMVAKPAVEVRLESDLDADLGALKDHPEVIEAIGPRPWNAVQIKAAFATAKQLNERRRLRREAGPDPDAGRDDGGRDGR